MKSLSHVWIRKYYLIDSAYPNSTRYLTPYTGKSVQYHISKCKSGRRWCHSPQGMQEMFNYRHSSLRGLVEQTFGVLKATWKIVDERMSKMRLESQIEIVIATCTLHNFMRLHERGINISTRPPSTNRPTFVELFDQDAKKVMKIIRNQIATAIWNGSLTWI